MVLLGHWDIRLWEHETSRCCCDAGWTTIVWRWAVIGIQGSPEAEQATVCGEEAGRYDCDYGTS